MNVRSRSLTSALIVVAAAMVALGTICFASLRQGYSHISNALSELEERAQLTRPIPMMRLFLLLTALLIVGATFGGCVTESDAPSLFVGMSRERLRTRFGEPLHVEHPPGGGEDWYYSFSSPLEVQANSDHDVLSGSDSVSVTFSSSTSTRECPIHMCPEGYVIAPLPSGHIVR